MRLVKKSVKHIEMGSENCRSVEEALCWPGGNMGNSGLNGLQNLDRGAELVALNPQWYAGQVRITVCVFPVSEPGCVHPDVRVLSQMILQFSSSPDLDECELSERIQPCQ